MRKALAVLAVVVVVFVALAMFMHAIPVIPFNSNGSSTSTTPHTIQTNTNTPPTTTPIYVRLKSLNGTIECLGRNTITRVLWSRMKDFNASDSTVNVYVAWVEHALTEKPIYALTADPTPKVEFKSGVGRVIDDLGYEYWWVDTPNWKAEAPSMDGMVRVGIIKLGFGTGIIVTAYQVGDHIDVVVHGTVLNATEYRETAMFRALATDHNLYNTYTKFFPKPSTVLYRILIPGHGSYLRVDNVTLPIKNVYVLIEIPVAINPPDQGNRIELPTPEYVGWMIIGRPALGLAIHLAYPPTANPLTLYKQLIVPLTLNVVTDGSYYLFDPAEINSMTSTIETPIVLRNRGGVCVDYAQTEAYFATIALGAITAPFSDLAHEMALLVLPSSVYGKVRTSAPDIEGLPGRGPINMYHDIDGDNVTDAGIVLANIDPQDYTLKVMEDVLKKTSEGAELYGFGVLNGDTVTSGLVGDNGLTWGGWFYVMGFTDYVRSLPDWLTPPWYPVLEEKVYDKLVKPPAPDELKYIATPFGMALADAKEVLNATMPPEKLAVPSYRLALRNVLQNIPVIDAGVKTSPIIFWQLLRSNTTTQTGSNQPSNNTGTSTETPVPPAQVTAVVNVTWNGYEYRGNTTVNGTLIVVVISKSSGKWAVSIWVGEDCAYSGPLGWSLKNELTVWFTWKGTSYKITVHIIKGGSEEGNSGDSSTETSWSI